LKTLPGKLSWNIPAIFLGCGRRPQYGKSQFIFPACQWWIDQRKKTPANPGNWKCQVLAPTIASESSPPAPRTSPHQELPAAHRMQGKTRPLPQGVEMWTWPVFVLHIYIYVGFEF